MAIYGSAVQPRITLSEAIERFQAAFPEITCDEATNVLIHALTEGLLFAHRPGEIGRLNHFQHWNGLLYPKAWPWATLHDDGTVSFDVSEGVPALRQAMAHMIEAKHAIEISPAELAQVIKVAMEEVESEPEPDTNNTGNGNAEDDPRDVAIRAILHRGEIPGRTIRWDTFHGEVLGLCRKRDSERGYGKRTIEDRAKKEIARRKKEK